MSRRKHNLLVMISLTIGTLLLGTLFSTGLNSKPSEIFEGLCSVLGGTLGAGGAALAVYFAFRWQISDQETQMIVGIYHEVCTYISKSISYYELFNLALKDDKAKEFVSGGFVSVALKFSSPIYFLAAIQNTSRFKDPYLVRSFYSYVEELGEIQKSSLFGGSDQPCSIDVQLRIAIGSLEGLLRSGFSLLNASDFDKLDFTDRQLLRRRIKDVIAESPVPWPKGAVQ